MFIAGHWPSAFTVRKQCANREDSTPLSLISAVALPFFHFGFRVLLHIAPQGFTDIVAFFELALFVTSNKPLIGSGVDQLASA
jgi:hypothetical protein